MASNDAAGAFDVHSLVGTHARFKYEDGRWYWGVIDGFSDTLSKIHVCLTDKDRKWHSVAPTPAPGTPSPAGSGLRRPPMPRLAGGAACGPAAPSAPPLRFAFWILLS